MKKSYLTPDGVHKNFPDAYAALLGTVTGVGYRPEQCKFEIRQGRLTLIPPADDGMMAVYVWTWDGGKWYT